MKTSYSQTTTVPQSPKGVGFYTGQDYQSNLLPWIMAAIGAHIILIFLIWLVFTILMFFKLIPEFNNLGMKPRDVEFVLVDNSPTEKPRHPTRNRAEHASRSGGQKIANRATAVPERAAGNPSPKHHTQAQPAQRPQPARQATPRQPAQRHQMAHAPRAPRQPQQQQQPAPTPAPRPAPPAPRMPSRTQRQLASAPTPSSPTIRMPSAPTPKNPSAFGGGPIARAASGGGASGGSASAGASGSPGSSFISGSPSRGGGQSGGHGGRGSYNQSGSPGGGGGRAGIDAEAEPDFGPYIAELQRRIRRNWAPPTEDRSKRVVAFFKIARDGRLLNCRIQQSSGSPAADQAALAAVRASAPFRPLPPNFKGGDIDVQFIFDYEIYGHGSAQMR